MASMSTSINFLLGSAQRAVNMQVKKNLAPFDLTPCQYIILECIGGYDIHSTRAIAARAGVDCSVVSSNLDKLEKKGLITRKINPDDRRQIQVLLTEMTIDLGNSMREAVDNAEKVITKNLEAHEVDMFCDVLYRIIAPGE